MSSSRKAVRERLAQILDANLTSAQIVYAYQPGDFGGQSPAVVVASSGSQRSRLTARGGQAVFFLDVFVFVLATQTGALTERGSADALDDVEQQLAAVLDDNQVIEQIWQAIDYAGQSETAFVEVDGQEYKRERIPLKISVFV